MRPTSGLRRAREENRSSRSVEASFDPEDSTWCADVIFIVVIGGIGTIAGALAGTLVFFLLREPLATHGIS